MRVTVSRRETVVTSHLTDLAILTAAGAEETETSVVGALIPFGFTLVGASRTG